MPKGAFDRALTDLQLAYAARDDALDAAAAAVSRDWRPRIEAARAALMDAAEALHALNRKDPA